MHKVTSLFLAVLFVFALLFGAMVTEQRASAAPASTAPMVVVPHIPAAAFMTWGPSYMAASVCCKTWFTLGSIPASSIGSGESIFAQQQYPTSRPCHWRVFFRTSNSPDYHTASSTLYYGTGYTNIARSPMPPDLSRADIQGNCDSYNGIQSGNVKASF